MTYSDASAYGWRYGDYITLYNIKQQGYLDLDMIEYISFGSAALPLVHQGLGTTNTPPSLT